MNPATILKSMYPEKFAELVDIVRRLAPDASDEASDTAAGELLVGLGQCADEACAAELAGRVFRDVLGKRMTPAESEQAGAEIYRWRKGWTDVLY